MSVKKTLLALVAGLGVAVLPLGLVAPGGAAAEESARKAASLKMVVNGGYDSYVGGQGITLTGQLPKAGVRTIWLERNMNRPGSTWTRIEDLPYRGTTSADGSFTMPIRASDMVDLSYRVRGAKGGGVTPGVRWNPKTQDVTLEVVNTLGLPIDPIPGLPFWIAADTTPDHVYGRPDLDGLPVFLGRQLTLQQRVSPTEWEDVPGGTTVVGPGGTGLFLAPVIRPEGEYVFRVRMEDWTRDGSDVGWHATFPTYVSVDGILDRDRPAGAARAAPATEATGQLRAGAPGDTAASRYKWNPVHWGYDWEEGQDLDSPPKNGPKKGRWIQYSDGTGRVGKDNGQLRLDSGRRLTRDGGGDFGTTRATLSGNALTYGRWETRLRAKTFEGGSKDYDVLLELVPDRAKDYQCGRHNITIASYTGSGREMTFGLNAGSTRFTKRIQGPSLSSSIPAFAVEVAKDHVSWFVDGKPVGVVKGKQHVPGVPMTLRFSLVGDQGEHANTSIYSDWQRSFGIDGGSQVRKGPKLGKQALGSCPG